jgi:hypothetical protein
VLDVALTVCAPTHGAPDGERPRRSRRLRSTGRLSAKRSYSVQIAPQCSRAAASKSSPTSASLADKASKICTVLLDKHHDLLHFRLPDEIQSVMASELTESTDQYTIRIQVRLALRCRNIADQRSIARLVELGPRQRQSPQLEADQRSKVEQIGVRNRLL